MFSINSDHFIIQNKKLSKSIYFIIVNTSLVFKKKNYLVKLYNFTYVSLLTSYYFTNSTTQSVFEWLLIYVKEVKKMPKPVA